MKDILNWPNHKRCIWNMTRGMYKTCYFITTLHCSTIPLPPRPPSYPRSWCSKFQPGSGCGLSASICLRMGGHLMQQNTRGSCSAAFENKLHLSLMHFPCSQVKYQCCSFYLLSNMNTSYRYTVSCSLHHFFRPSLYRLSLTLMKQQLKRIFDKNGWFPHSFIHSFIP